MRLEDYKPSEPAQVSCEKSDGKSTLIFIRQISHSPAKVWSALTEAEKLPKWNPFKPDRNLTEPGPVTLRMIDGSTPEIYESEVYEVVPQKRLKFSWGDSGILDWQLEPSAEGTRLTLRHTVDDPKWITPSAAGWHMCLDFAELLLDGNDIGPVLGEAAMELGWEKLAKHYGEVLGQDVEKFETDAESGAEEKP